MCFCTWIRIRRPLNRDPGSETLFWTTYICNPRTSLPTVWDDHLYGIETHILLEVQLKQLCLEALMGKEAGPAYSAEYAGYLVENYLRIRLFLIYNYNRIIFYCYGPKKCYVFYFMRLLA